MVVAMALANTIVVAVVLHAFCFHFLYKLTSTCRVGSSHSGWVYLGTLRLRLSEEDQRTITVSLPVAAVLRPPAD